MIRVGHHGDEHVEEDDEADGGVSPEHGHAQEFRVIMVLFQAEMVQVDQAVNGPKQRLWREDRDKNGAKRPVEAGKRKRGAEEWVGRGGVRGNTLLGKLCCVEDLRKTS